MADIARAAVASISTVSHVVNGTRRVSENAERAVREALQATGYTHDRIARSLATGRTRTIGLAMSCGVRKFDLPAQDGCLLRASTTPRARGVHKLGRRLAWDDFPAGSYLCTPRDPQMRVAAAKALGKLNALEAAQPLCDIAASDEVGWVRSHAAEALASLGDLRSTPLLVDLLASNRWRDRMAAAHTLGLVGDPAALGAVEAAQRQRSVALALPHAERGLPQRPQESFINAVTSTYPEPTVTPAPALGVIRAHWHKLVLSSSTWTSPRPKVSCSARGSVAYPRSATARRMPRRRVTPPRSAYAWAPSPAHAAARGG
jgi:hypothetical protein